MVVFGMEKVATPSSMCLQDQTSCPIDFITDIAASQNGAIKNNLQKACQLFKTSFSKKNPNFLMHPSFRTYKKDIRDIACCAAWFNDSALEKALYKNYPVSDISFTTITPSHFNMSSSCMSIAVNDLKKLRNKYNNNHSFFYCAIQCNDYSVSFNVNEVIPAFYCAIQCNDYEAINNIGLKIKQLLYEEFHKINLHKSLLIQLIEKDCKEMFEFIVKLDPFNALNSYCPYKDSVAEYHPSFLDFLYELKTIPQEKKDSYIDLYRKYGGKRLNELKKEADKRKRKRKRIKTKMLFFLK